MTCSSLVGLATGCSSLLVSGLERSSAEMEGLDTVRDGFASRITTQIEDQDLGFLMSLVLLCKSVKKVVKTSHKEETASGALFVAKSKNASRKT